MALALYRKYRPAKFAEVVGQEHVTEPLGTALAAGRINHAYLFSGPRGCGKTSSARILARSLNCVEGPTPDPCGVCSSCVALAPEGPGNIDVVELDAASHGGVDDARELRDRAFYAPAESRYRVFIVDEAHMVTTQGFNALLKIVEEPPEHLVFIFATTEPDKVLPTIRSRTHHYPFRLIPPGTLRALLERICGEEAVQVEPAVYPLVIRAGGGSARDTLSVMDQLLAGAGPAGVTYERAMALLGVTDVALIDDVVDALAAGDGASVFQAVDRLVEAGHDPRRFAADLLQRLRDLMLVQAVPEAAEQGLVDAAADELSRMLDQAARLGPATLARYGEIVHAGLTEMRGATAPRLLLELLCARMLLPAATTSDAGLLERLERVERRNAIAADPGPSEEGGGSKAQFVRPSQRRESGAPAAPAAAEPAPTRTPDAAPTRAAEAAPTRAAEAAPTRAPGAAAARSTEAASARPEPAATRPAPEPAAARSASESAAPARSAAEPAAPSRATAEPTAPSPATADAAASDAPAAQSAPSQAEPGHVEALAESRPEAQAAASAAADTSTAAAEPGAVEQGAAERGVAAQRGEAEPVAVEATTPGAGGSGGSAGEAPQGVSASAGRERPSGDPQSSDETAASAPIEPAASAAHATSRAAEQSSTVPDRSGTAAEPEGARTSASGPEERPAAPAAERESAEGAERESAEGSVAPPAEEPVADSGLDAGAVRRVWSEILAAARQRSRSTEALMVNATVRAVEGDTLVLSIGSPPLARRLADNRNTEVVTASLHAVLGVQWRVRVETGEGTAPAQAAPRQQAPRQAPQRPSRREPERPERAERTERTDRAERTERAEPTRTEPPAEQAQPARPRFQRPERAAPQDRPAGAPRGGFQRRGADDGVPLPPEPPDEEPPPDDEEAMIAEADASRAERSVRRDPEEVAIELLSSQLGARAFDQR